MAEADVTAAPGRVAGKEKRHPGIDLEIVIDYHFFISFIADITIEMHITLLWYPEYYRQAMTCVSFSVIYGRPRENTANN